MNKKNILKLSKITLIIGLIVLAIAYYFFHFVTDDGISLVWQPEAGKPFVADLIGQLGVHLLSAAVISLMISIIFFPKEEK